MKKMDQVLRCRRRIGRFIQAHAWFECHRV